MLPTAYISCILMPGINPLVATPPHAAIDTACPRGIRIKGTSKYVCCCIAWARSHSTSAACSGAKWRVGITGVVCDMVYCSLWVTLTPISGLKQSVQAALTDFIYWVKACLSSQMESVNLIVEWVLLNQLSASKTTDANMLLTTDLNIIVFKLIIIISSMKI
jgi:hypothetical protein